MGKFEELIKGDKPVLVDFFATWCGPCKAMHPILEELKKDMGDKIHIITIDVDGESNRALVMNHQIQSVPTLMIFKKGEMVWRQSGVMQSVQLKNVLEKYV
ncbi:thioredoxin [Culturomica massiliensis]|jgi:thioredoxin 1|uniref:thioredoxin n=1 Tax=Culturomica massiliensis TaxID=1841857 RepID=UPI0008380271|nr:MULTISPECIES: thioredoxin [Odoribacteraceae]RHV98351.1 thioredoxin [Odoribacter sp. OF09-27XD]